MQKFLLDFDIYYAKDRLEAIKQIDLNSLSKVELETVSNYVLYGKDDDDLSLIDKKKIYIKTKYNSYQRDKVVSLDEMMDNPSFNEAQLLEKKNNYKIVKPNIDHEKAKKITGMVELWDEIARQEENLKQETDPNKIYHLKHLLIQLKNQQYCLMDSYYPALQKKVNHLSGFTHITDGQLNYPVLPRGVMREPNDLDFVDVRHHCLNVPEIIPDDVVEKWEKIGKIFFDFRNVKHLYFLILEYEEIQAQIEFLPDSPLHNLLWTLDFYIGKANLSPQQKFILELKKKHAPNKEIVEKLLSEMGISHQENYISTIWNKSLTLIADAVELNYDEFLCRDYDKAWKVCCKCGRELLKDSRNFVKKKKSVDGLTTRCKRCDKALRGGQSV